MLSLNVKIGKCTILLVLLFVLPLNSSSLNGGSLDAGQSGQADSSQQIFGQLDGECFSSDKSVTFQTTSMTAVSFVIAILCIMLTTIVIVCFVSERFGNDQVINTVLNINDSNTAGILNNFNVSKDEILRRISALQPAVNNDSSRSLAGERQIESETNTSPSSDTTGTDADKQE